MIKRNVLKDGTFYPKIPTLCYCSCKTILWNGANYVRGHNTRTNNVMKNPEIAKKISGIYHWLKDKYHSRETCKKISLSVSLSLKGNKRRLGITPSNKITLSDGSSYPPIPDLCHCKKHCNEIVYNSSEFKIGHQSIGILKTEESIKNSRERMMGSKNPNYGKSTNHSQRCHSHTSPIQGEILMFRWEELYATYLDSIGEPYLYEHKAFPMIINRKETTYTPDFYLLNKNLYIEVKGYWRRDAKEKSDKFQEMYSKDHDYKILYGEDLKNLGIKNV